ncbi:hypothetical protein BGY98DRAFT_914762 [Russula aff. rugulosa BPL654]|nr:hypothetical protein BGY98DRAFT_914762 [Russula aff. rugulosa BPL654]
MSSSAESSQGCQIAEILQFTCEMQATKHETQRFHCFPIPRLFMLCQGQPAVEITRIVKLNPSTGEVDVPQDVCEKLPKARQWKDIIRSRS